MNIKDLINKVKGLWFNTEMELSSLSKKELINLLEELGNKVNAITKSAEDQLMICSHCDNNNINLCEPCLTKMAINYGEH
tara:strand:+ start:88 stop:327 length:240 start_codon:yes stop_codon:yes gene_type:complete